MNSPSFEKLAGDYQILSDLLQSQQEALDSRDEHRLANLRQLIDRYLKRIQAFNPEDSGFSEAEMSKLAVIASSLSRHVARNQERWQRELEGLRQSVRQLRAARLYVQQAGPSQQDRSPRVTHFG